MWHLIISVIAFNLVAYFIPKRISRQEMFTISLFALQLQAEADLHLDIMYGFYGYFNYGVDWLALLPIYGIFPAANIIFLNYYPFSGSTINKAFYILLCSILTTVYEWSAVQAGWFYYTGWQLWYSFFCYLLIYFLLIKSLAFFRWLNEDNNSAIFRS